jgi:hypothetical protein
MNHYEQQITFGESLTKVNNWNSNSENFDKNVEVPL